MRNYVRLLGAWVLSALAACSDSTVPVGTGATVTVLSVNGTSAASSHVAVDSVYVTAEVRLDAGAPALTSAVLVNGVGAVLGTTSVSVAPGAKAALTVSSHVVPSGTQTLSVRAHSADGGAIATSAPITVTVSRPHTYLRVLSVNGAPLPAGGGVAAVADSFLVDVMLVVADTGSVVDRIMLRRDETEFFYRTLNASLVQRKPGQTYRIPFAAWITVPGLYAVVMDVDHFADGGIETVATTGRIPVSVTNSDVTPPVILAPADELVVTNPDAIPFEASDVRGIWQYGLEKPGGCGTNVSLGIASPTTTASISDTRRLCLTPGRNRVIRRAIDTAGNVTTDEVTLVVPPSAAAAFSAAEPVRSVVRRFPDGTVEQVTGPMDAN